MKQREEKAFETKSKIINSAQKLIKLRGIDHVSVDEIVKDASVAKGSFYVYFKKKEDVLNVIGYHDFQEIHDNVIAMEGDLVMRLKYYMTAFMQVIIDGGIELCRSWVKTVIYPNVLECCKLTYDIKSITEILEFLNQKYDLNIDCTVLAGVINTHLYGMMICWVMADGKYDYQKEIDELIKKII